MSVTRYMGNLDQVFEGFHSLPIPYVNANGLKTKMWNLNGTITTPWFQSNYVEEYYKEDRDFLMVLELPDDIKDQVQGGSLILDLEVDTREEKGWFEEVSTLTFHGKEKIWSEAEYDCQKNGGHLVSVTSLDANQMVRNVAEDDMVWLGGRRGLLEWTWSDNSAWGYTNWYEGHMGSRDDLNLWLKGKLNGPQPPPQFAWDSYVNYQIPH